MSGLTPVRLIDATVRGAAGNQSASVPLPLDIDQKDEAQIMDMEISLDEVCRIVVRAREYDAQVPGTDPDDGSNASDDDSIDVLDDEANSSVEEEIATAIADLSEDEQAELYALMAIGRGDYEASEWEDAKEAITESGTDIVDELMETPMLASLLEAGLAAFGLSCDDVGSVS